MGVEHVIQSPEAAMVEAAVRYVHRRYGQFFRVNSLSLTIETPEGLVISPGIDTTAWYLAHASTERQEAKHSEDFRSVSWFGATFIFTPLQAAIVRQLWAASENGTPDVGIHTLLENAGSDVNSRRLDLVFRGHPAWKTMIVTVQRGLYRLNRHPSEGKSPDGPDE